MTIGIVYVVAFGNGHADASHSSLANFNNIILVLAVISTDCTCGEFGLSLQYCPGDTLACFSDYVQLIVIQPNIGDIIAYQPCLYLCCQEVYYPYRNQSNV